MADDFNQKPYEQAPDWATQQSEAQRVIAEQQAEIEAAKQAEQKRAEAAAAEESSPEDEDRRQGARFGRAIAMERTRAARGGKPGAAKGPDTSVLDKEIAKLEKVASDAWRLPYFSLLFWAAVVDLLQLVTDVTLILAIVASLIGIIFSAARYLIIHLECRRIEDEQYRKEAVARTLIAGAISMIPWVDLLPEQTMGMLYEYNKRKLMADQAASKLKAKREEREQLVAAARAQQEIEEIEEAEELAA